MLDLVRGTVESISADAAVISIGGVGLRVEMPTGDLARINGEVTLHTVLQIRDENVHLYGFLSERGRELFRSLITVGGVGPKVALAVLSFHPPDALERVIATGDEGALGAVAGVGKKTASRIVLELRDKVGAISETLPAAAKGSSVGEVREALIGLGYSPQEIQASLAGLPTDGDAPTLLRHALRALGRDTTGASSTNGKKR